MSQSGANPIGFPAFVSKGFFTEAIVGRASIYENNEVASKGGHTVSIKKLEAHLELFGITKSDVEKAGFTVEAINDVAERYAASMAELQIAGDAVLQRLREVPQIHSLKMRLKEEEHLIAKILRKQLEKPDCRIDLEKYHERITDLIGIRALHLFKDEWKLIHDFVTKTWNLHETPTAYIRDGDPQGLQDDFTKAGCDVKKHQFGYRSIHYLLESQPEKTVRIIELQVRTIFEEGWSEIDHRVRYPSFSDNSHLLEVLTVFNRLAGSADEMGTYIKNLNRLLTIQAETEVQLENQKDMLKRKEAELQKALSELEISDADRNALKKKIDEIGVLASRRPTISFLTPGEPIKSGSGAFLNFCKRCNTPMDVAVLLKTGQETLCSKCYLADLGSLSAGS